MTHKQKKKEIINDNTTKTGNKLENIQEITTKSRTMTVPGYEFMFFFFFLKRQ